MRKIFYIFILMVSSFFVFNNNVKADTLSYVVDEQDIAYINEDFYKVREWAINRANNYEKYYIIIYNTTKTRFEIYLFNVNTFTYTNSSYDNILYPYIYLSLSGGQLWYLSNGTIQSGGYPKTLSASFYNNSYSNKFTYINYLDTNIELFTGKNEHTYTLTYNDFSFTFSNTDHFPSLYEFKTIFENPPVQEPERNESLDSFYYLIMEKIELFANYFITNSTLLFIIGIIILIFIIELIFRRYL